MFVYFYAHRFSLLHLPHFVKYPAFKAPQPQFQALSTSDLFIVSYSFKEWMAIRTCWSFLKERKRSYLANI